MTQPKPLTPFFSVDPRVAPAPTQPPDTVAQANRDDARKARPPSDAEPWVVADDEGVRLTFRTEDSAWRYRNEYTDRLTNPTVTHEPAAPKIPDDYWLHVRGCDCAYCEWERQS